ncbi:P-II family nitrogen regulator [Billgrantia kenyensis]|uniref:P-II family nitrogen regulator n=1 Tax=Billgrantia kenyensis TaxID=321266 RepID=A0A7W0AEK0_9GAMM|nr:P-II family nitrogen regulator [Halomonas kenyensis]MBA2780188.1 P-II family nitrogen regulator [Halomonas kenyensis]MCG6663156.1 P-II family nitrogen regulator [Halomonas kenyensis]
MDFKLLMVFVDQDRTEAVLKAAREGGATGATIINNAQGQGLKPHLTFFGLEFMASRSVILILAEARRSESVLKAVTAAGKLDETLDTGIALELEVSKTVGLTEHIKALSEKHPIK